MRSHKKALALLLTAGLVMSSFSYLAFAEDEIDDAVAALDAEQAVVQQDEEEEEAAEEATEEAAEAVPDEEAAIDDDTADLTDKVDEELPDPEVTDEDVAEDEDIPEEVDEATTEDEEVEEDVEVPQYGVDITPTTSKHILMWGCDTTDHATSMRNRISALYTAAGATVTMKTSGALTEADLKGIDVVIIMCIFITKTSTDGVHIIESADLLLPFVESGGALILQGEHDGYATDGNRVLETLAADMGFNFSISGEYSRDDTEFNVDQMPELSNGLNGYFRTAYIGSITTSDSDAVWLARSSYYKTVCMLEKPVGSGFMIALSDYNYLQENYNTPEIVTQFLCNIANQANVHTHKFEITASGDTLTAKCVTANCSLDPSSASITINAPTLEYIGGEGDAFATLSSLDDFNAFSLDDADETQIFYEGTGDTVYAKSQTAPVEAGTYTASFVYSNNNAEYEISVDYEIEPPRIEFVDSDGQVFVKESDTILTFHAVRSADDDTLMNDLDKVLVDNTEVPEDGMELLAGSIIVKLKPSYLNTLSVGKHSFSLSFKDGRTVSIDFTVKAAPKSSPQTGEYAGPAVLAVAAVLMAAGAVTCVKTFKKKED